MRVLVVANPMSSTMTAGAGSGKDRGRYALKGSLVVGVEGPEDEAFAVGLQVSAGAESSWWAMSDESMGV